MQHLTISIDGIDGARLLHDWQWLLSGSRRLLAITRMGDAFVEKADGEVVFLDTLEGALKHAVQAGQQRGVQGRRDSKWWERRDQLILCASFSQQTAFQHRFGQFLDEERYAVCARHDLVQNFWPVAACPS